MTDEELQKAVLGVVLNSNTRTATRLYRLLPFDGTLPEFFEKLKSASSAQEIDKREVALLVKAWNHLNAVDNRRLSDAQEELSSDLSAAVEGYNAVAREIGRKIGLRYKKFVEDLQKAGVLVKIEDILENPSYLKEDGTIEMSRADCEPEWSENGAGHVSEVVKLNLDEAEYLKAVDV